MFCHGVSFGKRAVVARKATWKVGLENGVNQLLARGVHHGRAVTDKAQIDYKAVTVNSPDIAINVGSNADFTDAENIVWMADQPYRNGSWGFVGNKARRIYSDTPDRDVLGTEADPLYQTMVEGLKAYRIDVPAGEYDVELLFAETKFDAAEKRIFSVAINGSSIIADLDLAKQAGRSNAFSKRVRVRTAGGVSAEFGHVAGEPILSGIRVVRVSKR